MSKGISVELRLTRQLKLSIYIRLTAYGQIKLKKRKGISIHQGLSYEHKTECLLPCVQNSSLFIMINKSI